jgi:hypothetical protein
MSRSKKKQAAELVKKAEAKVMPAKKKRKGRGVLLLGVGIVVAMVASAELRSKVLDALFGSEEEFDYTSTTTPATPAPTAA